jgi:hypothetical protein
MTTTSIAPAAAELETQLDIKMAEYDSYLTGKPWWTTAHDSAKYRDGRALSLEIAALAEQLADAVRHDPFCCCDGCWDRLDAKLGTHTSMAERRGSAVLV